jgi:hypothetical protein
MTIGQVDLDSAARRRARLYCAQRLEWCACMLEEIERTATGTHDLYLLGDRDEVEELDAFYVDSCGWPARLRSLAEDLKDKGRNDEK